MEVGEGAEDAGKESINDEARSGRAKGKLGELEGESEWLLIYQRASGGVSKVEGLDACV
jgi:hypothetical protein